MSTPALFENADTGPFDGDELRADQERAHLLLQLTEHPGWAELARLVETEAGKYERKLMNGTCRDYPDYLATTMYVKALRWAIETPANQSEQIELHRKLSRPEEEE